MNERHIILRLIGGLGNQLFQLQFAYCLTEKFCVSLKIDQSYLSASKKLHEKLAITPLLDDQPVMNLSFFDLKIQRSWERLLYKLDINQGSLFGQSYLFENYDGKLPNRKKLIVDGFWQNKIYFNENFINRLKFSLININKSKVDSNQICVHIRRGDYLTNRRLFRRQQIVLPMTYYLQAFDIMKIKVQDAKFDIFTDDEAWAASEFGDIPNLQVIPSSHLSPFELLATMSSYSNFVIANSSLSWWAAVSARNVESPLVIMPKIWGINSSSENFRLNEWISV